MGFSILYFYTMNFKMLYLCSLLSLLCCKDKGGDNSPPPVFPTLTIEEGIQIAEGSEDHSIFVSLRLSGSATENVVAFVQTEDITAKAGEDYEAVNNQRVDIAAGSSIAEVKITIKGDAIHESDETFSLKIESVTGARLSADKASISILNDDIDTNIFIPSNGYTSLEDYAGMTRIWQDEFNASTVDQNHWTFEIGTGNSGWGNNELQFYRKENTYLREGKLIIEARQENFNGSPYTSSRMITKDKFDFKYGRVDIRAALPFGQGVWPALWMLGANISTVGWPSCGEIDIMEIVGHQAATLHGTAHWSGNGNHVYLGGETTLSSGIFYDEFHVFSVIWDANEIRWLLDDQQYYSLDITDGERTEFHDPFFFIFNVAVGGNWPGSPDQTTQFPQRMIVDYIRVFQDQ